MPSSSRLVVSLFSCLVAGSATFVLADGPAPKASSSVTDVRLAPPKDLNGYFPFTPPKTAEAWNTRREEVRRQVLAANGLWPLPTKTPLNAIVHGRVERDDFTVDRVAIETVPGHYLCGSLFKPKKLKDKNPVVLSPHGHGKDGRFQDTPVSTIRGQIVAGAERFEQGGRSIYQARCVQLARMGIIAFLYDMEGYADTTQLSFELVHRYGVKRPEMETAENWGFYSPQAEARLQSIMGLQTWNNIRALDFVLSLPEVDPTRVGVTGESGGGTQTMLLGAVDDRPTAIVPAVMVSTSMQGGCTCENCSLLRVETGNIEFAALFAPKPQGLIAADDWTREIMTKGLPELKELYATLGAPKNIEAYPFIHFPHNYNYVSRSAMYQFYNRQFKLGLEAPVVEEDYRPLSREELTVWTDEQAKPESGDAHERRLVRYLTEDAENQIAALTPTDAKSLAEYRRVVGGGVDAIVGRRLGDVGKIEQENLEETDRGDYLFYRCRLTNPARGEVVNATYYYPKQWNDECVVWLDEKGLAGLQNTGGEPIEAVAKLVKAGYAVAGVDLLGQGNSTPSDFPRDANRRVKNERMFAGYTYGYNHPLLVQQAHDALTVVAHARNDADRTPKKIHLVALGDVGPIAALAAAQCGEALDRAAIDLSIQSRKLVEKSFFSEKTRGGEGSQGGVTTHLVTPGPFRFANVTDFLDASFVPGLVKYGDVPGLLAFAAPRKLFVFGETEVPTIVKSTHAVTGTEVTVVPCEFPKEVTDVTPKDRAIEAVMKWLTAK